MVLVSGSVAYSRVQSLELGSWETRLRTGPRREGTKGNRPGGLGSDGVGTDWSNKKLRDGKEGVHSKARM